MTTPLTRVRTATVSSAQAGRRLDNVLATLLKGTPRSLLYKLLRSGQVRVNGGRVKPEYRVAVGDEIRIPPVHEHPASGPPRIPPARIEACRAAILYEDAQFIVLNKSSGMPCHGGSGVRYGVIEVMRAMRPEIDRLDLGHRLDRETSGCLVFTKNLDALQHFHAALRERDTRKYYVALLRGHLDAGLSAIDATLTIDRAVHGERRAAVSEAGRAARTVIETRQPCGPHTLASLRLVTGRMHQIRAHARHIRHPVAGDRDYGDAAFNRELKGFGLKRLFLHAERIALDYGPIRLDIHAPLPEELALVRDRLAAQR